MCKGKQNKFTAAVRPAQLSTFYLSNVETCTNISKWLRDPDLHSSCLAGWLVHKPIQVFTLKALVFVHLLKEWLVWG